MILLISPKNVYATKRLVEEAKLKKVKMEVFDVADLVERKFEIDAKQYNVLYVRMPYLNGSPKYIPNIIKLAKKFKAAGKKVVDSVIAEGELARGKYEDYLKLKKSGLPIPRTNKQLTINNLQLTDYPFIAKWIYGFKGRGTFYISSRDDLKNIPSYIPKDELLAQEFIPAEYEYKIITVGYKALPVILRFKIDPKTHRSDFNKYDVIRGKAGQLISRLAGRASKVLGRELAKADILQKGKKFYILEVNRFPGLDSFEELTKYNIAKEFLKYLTEK